MKEKVFLWLYRVFSFIVPAGIALYTFVIDKLLDKKIGVVAKIGIGGIFALVVMFIIAIFFFGKFLKKKIAKHNDQILLSTNFDEKQKFIAKRKKVEAIQEIFHNIIFVTPFLICYILMVLVEKGVADLRGTFMFVTISMAIGLGFNGIKQYIYTTEKKEGNEESIKKIEQDKE